MPEQSEAELCLVKKIKIKFSLLAPLGKDCHGKVPILATKDFEFDLTAHVLEMLMSSTFTVHGTNKAYSVCGMYGNKDFAYIPPIIEVCGAPLEDNWRYIDKLRRDGWKFNDKELEKHKWQR